MTKAILTQTQVKQVARIETLLTSSLCTLSEGVEPSKVLPLLELAADEFEFLSRELVQRQMLDPIPQPTA